jgi:hypothetical protein
MNRTMGSWKSWLGAAPMPRALTPSSWTERKKPPAAPTRAARSRVDSSDGSETKRAPQRGASENLTYGLDLVKRCPQ